MSDPISFDPTSAAIQAGLGLVQTAVGLVNSGKAKREANLLARTRPQYSISPEAGKELSLSESELGSGLSSQAQNAYNQLENRQFSSSIDAILRGGGTVNNVGDVFDSSEAGRLRLAQLQDQLRLSKINNLINSRRYMTEQTDKAVEFNQWMLWADKARANAEARKNAENMIWSGLGTAGAGGINWATGSNDAKMYNKSLNPSYNGGGFRSGGNEHGFNQPISQPVSRVHNNATPLQTDWSNFNIPDYLNDPLWMQGGHNMFGG